MKPKILIVIPDLGPGGAQPMNLRLAQELQKRGWPVRVVALFDRWLSIDEEVYKGLAITHLGKFILSDRLLLPKRLANLSKKADIVIGGVEQAATTYGSLGAYLARRPFIALMNVAFHLHKDRLGILDRLVIKAVYRKSRWVIFPSQGAHDSLHRALCGKPSHAVWQVIEYFLPSTQKIPAGVPPDHHLFSKPVVMGIGRLAEQKAFERLIRAHVNLRHRGLEHHMVILGEGPNRAELEAEIWNNGVEDTAFLPGHVTNVIDWLAHATIFALCSRYEGFGLVLLEALSCGIPSVAMDCPSGPREILQDGQSGLLVPDGDETAFQEALARLLTSPELHALYSSRGRERAKYYSPERVIPKWEVLLEEVASSSR